MHSRVAAVKRVTDLHAFPSGCRHRSSAFMAQCLNSVFLPRATSKFSTRLTARLLYALWLFTLRILPSDQTPPTVQYSVLLHVAYLCGTLSESVKAKVIPSSSSSPGDSVARLMEMKRRSTLRLYLQRVTFLVLLLLLNGLSATTTTSSQSSQQQRTSLPPPTESEKQQTKAFLILCTSDGKLYTLDAWTGSFHAVETAGPPLVTRSSSSSTQPDASGKASSSSSNTQTAASIVPGLDGRLYWQQSQEDGGELQPLELTISSLMNHPVRTCTNSNGDENNNDENNNDENTNETTDCGILTASAHTRLLALNEHGRLVWTSDGTAKQDNENSQEETTNPVGQPDQTVLLQRKDYWVQQVSSRSGKQVWNVSLGTYQALAFDDEDDQDESSELQEEQLLLPGRVQDKKETLSATTGSATVSKSSLPAIQFSDSGRTLSAIHPATMTVLWRVETPNVLVSVFGLYKGKWRSLHIVEEDSDSDNNDSTGPETLLLAASSDHHDDPPIPLDWWFPQKYATHHSLFLQQGLLPSAPSASNTVQQQQEQQVCISGDCPNFRQLPLRLPAPPPVIMAQPQGLVLSWSVVLVLFWTTLLAVIGGRLWYMRKKHLWTQRTGQAARQQYKLTFSDSNSSSGNGNGNNNNDTTLKHSTSLPDLRQEATRKPRSLSNAHSTDLMHMPHTTNTTGSPSTAQAVVPPVLQQHGGIPLVRYSRYASEFEELAALGKGGFGTVFKCRNVLDGREYAVKKVTIVGETTEESFQQRLQRVLREVKILAVLDHPNIVRYYTAWLEIDKEGGGGREEEEEERRSRNDAYTIGEASMSRCHSDSSFLTESVSQWTIDESPVRRTSYHQSLNNPLGWKNDFGLSQESSLPSHRHLQQEGSMNEDSIFERSEDNETISEVPRNTFSTSTSPSASHSPSRPPTGAVRNRVANLEQRPSNSSSKAAAPTRHTLYIQMQLCTQKTVGDFLSNPDARKGSAETGVDIPAALSLFLQIVQAVRHVHAQGLIHRDLKPLNCFMDESGTIKVGDFGLSREATDKVETSGASAVFNDDEDHTAGVGTRAYASPEQMEGSNYDSSTDVFSLGVVLFELLYPMYTGMERSICLTKLRQLEFPSNYQATVGKAYTSLQDLIKSMLSHNAADRPSAEEVAQHIHSLLGEFTIMSLDKYDPETMLIRVEADHGDNILHETMQLIHKAALPGSVEIVQYGLRSAKSGTVAIMEFALQTSTLQGPFLVSQLTERAEIIKVRQISSNSTTVH